MPRDDDGNARTAGGFARSSAGNAVGRSREDRNSCAQVRGRIVEKFHYERIAFERVLHDPALDSPPSPVDQTHLTQAGRMRGAEVLMNDGRDVARREGMQIERVLDRDRHRVFVVHGC